MGDDAMRAAGAMGYAMEAAATREYWFNEYGGVWPPVYSRSVVGILWDNGQEFQTYFGTVPIYMHGIQMLPLSPGSMYLAQNPAYSQQQFNRMLAEQLASTGANSISSMGAQWGNYALWYALQFNPDYAAAQMDQLYVGNDPVATDPVYAPTTYYFTHAYRKLGAQQWVYHLSVPTSAVYYSTNTGLYTYVAYNPKDTPEVATVYSNQVAIGTLDLPARTLVNTQTLAGVAPPQTNVVSAAVLDGVGLSWPTEAQSNYVVEAAADLTPAAWTNLSGTIQGDGATQSWFDPLNSNECKFYRVRSP